MDNQNQTPTKQTASSASSPIPQGNTGYVGFWRRVAAYLIDSVILFCVSLFLSILTGSGFSYSGAGGFTTGPSLLIGVLYFLYFWIKQNGQTIGNKVMKIRVIREDGHSIDITTGIIRYIGLIISFLPFGLGVLWVAWDNKKQGWHDKIAKTVVVKA